MKNLIVIGAGRAGTTLAGMFQDAGYVIKALCCESSAGATEAKRILDSHGQAIAYCDALVDGALSKICTESRREGLLIVLGVQDARLAIVAEELLSICSDWRGVSIVHLSGGTSEKILEPFESLGARTGVFHPCFPMASRDTSLPRDGSVCFTYVGNDELGEKLAELSRLWAVRFVNVSGVRRESYHASLVCAAGHFSSLLAQAEGLLCGAGVQTDDARAILRSVSGGVIENLSRLPADKPMANLITGPFVRNDQEMILAHRKAIESDSPDSLALYDFLGALSLKILGKE
jgi:predicted short-subunit dehydrogenase-like oxidoreductase (DUF2520 family)